MAPSSFKLRVRPMNRRTMLATSSMVVIAAGGLLALSFATPGSSARVTAGGTTIGGLPAGNLDRAALTTLLTRTTTAGPADLAIVLGTRRVTVAVADLGFIDVAATVDSALRRSHEAGGQKGREVAPTLSDRDRSFDRVVTRVQKASEVAEFHGELHYVRGVMEVVGPSGGQTADRATIRRALLAAAGSLPRRSSVRVSVRPRAAHVTKSDLDRLALAANALLTRPVELRAGNRAANVSARELGPQLAVMALGSQPGHPVTLGLKPTARDAVAVPAARELEIPAGEPRVRGPEALAILRAQGSVTWRPVPARTTVVSPGRLGQAVRPDVVLTALAQFVQGKILGTGPVPVTSTPLLPRSPNAAAGSINAVLGTFTTPFHCCQPRVRNISLIARTVDGTLIGPGQTFSLNGLVGRRTKAKGYVEAPFILDGELSTDIGGGVSQFATTTFNAAFFAGLRLDRHQAHSFYISRYPAGREATVNYPTIDLRWTNDSGAPILVRAATTATSLTVTLYGRDDRSMVTSVSGPRIPVSGGDFRITVSRVVSVSGRPARRESFTTTYDKPPKGE
jgi:hypothetical protein